MGKVYFGKCMDCGYEGRYFIGGGLQNCNLLENIAVLSDDAQHQIRALDAKNEIMSFEIERMVSVCPNCNAGAKPFVSTVITVQDIHRQTHVFGVNCPHCNVKLVRYTEKDLQDTQTVKCPSCQAGYLTFSFGGLWD